MVQYFDEVTVNRYKSASCKLTKLECGGLYQDNQAMRDTSYGIAELRSNGMTPCTRVYLPGYDPVR